MKNDHDDRVRSGARRGAEGRGDETERIADRARAAEPHLHARLVHSFLTGRRLRRGLAVLRRAGHFSRLGAGRIG